MFLHLFMTNLNSSLKRSHLEHFLKLFCLVVFFLTVALRKNVFSRNFLLFISTFGHVVVKGLYWILKFWNFKWFLKRLRLKTFFGLIAFTYRHKPQTLKIVFLRLAMPQWNISSKFRNFECFLAQTLSHIFLFKSSSYVLILYKNIQIPVPESGHAIVQYFILILKLWMFLKQILSQFFAS